MKIIFLEVCFLLTTFALLAAPAIRDSYPVIILMGPPGSGKGTQAKRIAEEMKVLHISTGDILRENIRSNTELGKKAKVYMDAGKLVPDELIMDILFDRVSKPDAKNGYLLDGFPRTIAQADALSERLKGTPAKVVVINLDVPDAVLIKRISGRLICVECDAVYNRYFDKIEDETVCPKCGGSMIQRPDDKEEVVVQRLKVYSDQTKPLIEYYQKKDLLTNIDGNQDPVLVNKAVMKVLHSTL